MLSAITAECCPTSAWNRVRDRAEYASTMQVCLSAPHQSSSAVLRSTGMQKRSNNQFSVPQDLRKIGVQNNDSERWI
jgi:hypothetical protein